MKKIEMYINFIVLFILSGAFERFFSDHGIKGAINFLLIAWYLFCFFLILYSLYKKRPKVNIDITLVGLCLICFLSLIWTQYRSITLKYDFILLLNIIYCIYIYMRYSTVDLIKLVFYVIFLGAILSVYLIIFHPSLAAGNNMYLTNFEGVYSHKNFLGRSMSLGCIISIFYYRFNKKASILNFIVCIVALYFSKSGTSYVILAIMILLLLLLKYRKRINILLVTGIPTLLIVIGLTAGSSILSDSMGYMNKDLTFTGRTYIWKYAINQIKKQPLLGYGYKAFWPTKADESQYVYIKEIDNNITHAHDGFINTAAEIGLIGSGIMILMVVNFLYSNRTIGIGEYEKCFMVIYFYFFIFNNITETSFLNTNNLYWMMIVVFIIKESYKARGGSIIDRSIGKGILNGAQ